jgi:hydrogenase-4 component B
MTEKTALLLFFISSFTYLASFISVLILHKNERQIIRTTSILNILAGLCGSVMAVSVLITGGGAYYTFSAGSLSELIALLSPADDFSIKICPYAALFLLIIYFISAAAALYSRSYLNEYTAERVQYSRFAKIAIISAVYPLFILSMAMVVVSNHSILFLGSWELMSLFSYFLVISDHENPKTRTAGFTYLIMTHFGTAFLFVFFVMLYSISGSFNFSAYTNIGHSFSNAQTLFMFMLILIGFGTKAGIMPLHIWLPLAHPQAPSHVSAIMSGVMVKVSLFAFLKCLFMFLGGANLAAGVILLVIGAITAILGIMYSIVESDLKKCLAFSTVENIGIILIAISCAIILNSQHYPVSAAFALCAAFYHITAHALFKSLLFMGAGSVIYSSHAKNMDDMGGFIKQMPHTAAYFMAGVMSMAALPPMAGFISEWMVFQSILLTLKDPQAFIKIIMPVCGAALALSSALALTGAVRMFFSIFLAKRRNADKYKHVAKETPLSMRLPMLVLAVLCFVFGIFSPVFIYYLAGPLHSLIPVSGLNISLFSRNALYIIPVSSQLSAISPQAVFTLLILFIIGAVVIFNYILPRRKVRYYETWSCGADINSIMQYTPESYTQPIMIVFKNIYMPRTEVKTLHNEDRLIIKKVDYSQTATMFFEKWLYRPFIKLLIRAAKRLKKVQLGYVHIYLLYIFVTLILALLSVRL